MIDSHLRFYDPRGFPRGLCSKMADITEAEEVYRNFLFVGLAYDLFRNGNGKYLSTHLSILPFKVILLYYLGWQPVKRAVYSWNRVESI